MGNMGLLGRGCKLAAQGGVLWAFVLCPVLFQKRHNQAGAWLGHGTRSFRSIGLIITSCHLLARLPCVQGLGKPVDTWLAKTGHKSQNQRKEILGTFFYPGEVVTVRSVDLHLITACFRSIRGGC